MLLIRETRVELGELIDSILASAGHQTTTVYRSGTEPLMDFPCVVIGQPSWTPTGPTMGVQNEYSWPIAVVLERPGEPSPVTVDVLDEIWSALLAGLINLSKTDASLGGIARQSIVTGSTSEPFTVQGIDYPAQTIYLSLYS